MAPRTKLLTVLTVIDALLSGELVGEIVADRLVLNLIQASTAAADL
jgi:hypothetical protein